jgi:hypothetical protein
MSEELIPIENDGPSLNRKQLAFLDEYERNGWNQTAAYMTVYGQKNPTFAGHSASELMKKDYVVAELKRREEYVIKVGDIKRDDLIRQLKILSTDAKRDSDKLKAIDLLAAMGGFYKQEGLINIDTQSIKLSFGNGFNPNNTSNGKAIE